MNKVNPEARTLLDMRPPEKISTSSALAISPAVKIRERRSALRGKVLLVLAAFGLGAGSGSYGTYQYLKSHNLPVAISMGRTDLVPQKKAGGMAKLHGIRRTLFFRILRKNFGPR